MEPRPAAKITAIVQEDDLQALCTAVAALEHPRLAARLAEIAGKPIELFNRALPETVSKAIAIATTQALNTALRVALRTMHNEPKAASSYLHKALAATSGAVGGSFGLPALAIELPISTVIMLRSIGDIARAEGEDLHDPETVTGVRLERAERRGRCREYRLFCCAWLVGQIGCRSGVLHC